MKYILIGPGQIDSHIKRLIKHGKIKDENKYWQEVNLIVNKFKDHELILLPDRGLPFEIAKRAREKFGDHVKITYTIPQDDKNWGVAHLEKQIKELKPDKIINTGDWQGQHFMFGLFGEAIVYLGHTTGTMYELSNTYYIHKLTKKMKNIKEIDIKILHNETEIQNVKKLVTYVHKPFLIDDFPVELREIINEIGGEIKTI